MTTKNMYANFLPINAVSGSSLTLIKKKNHLDYDSIIYFSNFIITEKI